MNTTFRWTDIEIVYIRDMDRVANNVGQRTNIVKHAVFLDKYTMMNASYAKQFFSEKQYASLLLTYI